MGAEQLVLFTINRAAGKTLCLTLGAHRSDAPYVASVLTE